MTVPATASPGPCSRCGTELAAALLRCPGCQALVHAGELQRLAGDAEAAERDGHPATARDLWQQALSLLPVDAPQRATVVARLERAQQQIAATGAGGTPAGPRPKGIRGLWVGLITAVLFLLGKLKFLLLGFTKLGTLFSMLAFFAVYWNAWGWAFAAGFVICIYIHEMGHVAMLKHYGIPASAPMFIPGLGALVRLKAHPPTPGQDARVGLAGPIWGAGAALGCLAIYQVTERGLYASLAHAGAYINLFNLIPFWQLDGGRGISALTRAQRCLLLVAVVAAWLLFREGILLVIGAFLVFQCFREAPVREDQGVLLQFGLLIGLLGYLSTVRG